MVSKKKRRHGNGGTEAEKENDEGRVADYELSREQRIKENLERMHKLGILELSRNLKPTHKPTIIRPKKPLPPLPTSQRRSSRIQTMATVDYSEKRAKDKVIIDVKIDLKACHQCRHKTSTHLTNCCKCKIVQGQYCGDCLLKRYGEDILEAMANPDWVCPLCRDICNCSRCRRAKGWKPTGSLYRKGLCLGFKSVVDYLIHFQGPDGKIYDMDNKTSDEEEDDKDDILIENNIKHGDHTVQWKRDDDSDCKSESLDDDDSDYKSDSVDEDSSSEEDD